MMPHENRKTMQQFLTIKPVLMNIIKNAEVSYIILNCLVQSSYLRFPLANDIRIF